MIGNEQLRVVLYGDGLVPNTGGFCYAAALRELGHDVVCVSERAEIELYSKALWARALRRVRGQPLELHRRRHIERLTRAVSQASADLVIVLKGLLIGPDDVGALQRSGAWVANINHDDFFSQNPHNWSTLQRRAIPSYDFIFTTREVNLAEVAPLNPRVEFMPFAYHPAIHRPLEISSEERARWESDVAFIGTWERERCRLLEQLVRAVPARYSIWGSDWQRVSRRSPLRPYLKYGAVMGDEMAKAIGSARISLGFLRKLNRDDYTQRTFEIPACGGVLLAERTARHQSYYVEGVEAEFFDSADAGELIRKVQALLSDRPRTESIRAAGRTALLRQHHTYRDRMQQLIEVYRRRARL
ncbi:MAG TPA: glycosyltransferase [Polyangiales bacterium]|nr:glycosyltransferase [Polyangiales bacterium]